MNNELVEKLKWIRSEVLALKQAHEYGLNSPKFYYKIEGIFFESSGLDDTDIRVSITFDTDSTEMPMVIWNTTYHNFYGQVWDSNLKKLIFSYSELWIFTSNYFSLTATKPIKSLVMEVVS